jgi:hypothetical protein
LTLVIMFLLICWAADLTSLECLSLAISGFIFKYTVNPIYSNVSLDFMKVLSGSTQAHFRTSS